MDFTDDLSNFDLKLGHEYIITGVYDPFKAFYNAYNIIHHQ